MLLSTFLPLKELHNITKNLYVNWTQNKVLKITGLSLQQLVTLYVNFKSLADHYF